MFVAFRLLALQTFWVGSFVVRETFMADEKITATLENIFYVDQVHTFA